MAIQTEIGHENGIVILAISGKIDSFSLDDLNAAFNTVMKKGGKKILLDMKGLRYINSKGIGSLISFLKWVEKIGGAVRLADVHSNIKETFQILGLERVLPLYDSLAEAMESFD
jgi:anti-sigma B factor antagonist